MICASRQAVEQESLIISGVIRSTACDLLPVVMADEFQNVIVGIAKVEALVAFSPVHDAFDFDLVQAQVLLPLFCFLSAHGKGNMCRP